MANSIFSSPLPICAQETYVLLMMKTFPIEILRDGAPTEPSFSVSEVPHRAKLDQNESPCDIPKEAKQHVLNALGDAKWNRYPQPKKYVEVKKRFAAAVDLDPDQLILTVGCDQIILLTYWAAGGPGRTARIFEPSYPIFGALARTTHTTLDQVVLGPDFDVAARGLGDPVDLMVLVAPNNPTGNGPNRELILEALAKGSLVFVDEAYADYAEDTVIDIVEDYPNLLVGRSLSKALLAGVRLGYAMGHPSLINVLERLIFAPYHLNALQLLVAEHFDAIKPHLKTMVRSVIAERHRVANHLGEMGLRVYPSKANFILFEADSAARTYRGLLDRGVRIRDVSAMPGMGEHLRVTIGSRNENDIFLEAVSKSV